MADFPVFMKNPINRIAPSLQSTPGVDGYVYDGVDGSQMAFWTCTETAISSEHVHDFDEYVIIAEGCYTLTIKGQRITLKPGQEFFIPRGIAHGSEVIAGTRTIHAFGGMRVARAQHGAPLSFTLGIIRSIRQNGDEEMTTELSGTCGCEAVRYKITGPIRVVVNCHCNTCRKNNGASYSTYCVVAQSDMTIIEGQESTTTFEALGGVKKRVCSKCGSPLYNAHHKYPGMYMVHYGSISEQLAVTPSFNIYCENKLPWVENISAIKSFEQSIER